MMKKSIKIFGNDVNLSEIVEKVFQNTGIEYAKYDKIDKIERVSLFGLCELPVWITKTVCREYCYEMKEIPPEQAAAEGLAELRRLTDDALLDGELLEKTLSTAMEDGVYRISCILYIRRDIGETAEFRAD